MPNGWFVTWLVPAMPMPFKLFSMDACAIPLIGVQGLADVFMMMDLPFESEEAIDLDKKIFECMYYHALKTSCELAKIRGPYSSFHGSPASNGILQFDMWGKGKVSSSVLSSSLYDWDGLKIKIQQHGLRNSCLLAPMPTASSSQIGGNTEGIDPLSSNLYTRHTLAGNFLCVNRLLIKELEKQNMWNEQTRNHLIQHNGSVQNLTEFAKKSVFKTVWEISQKKVIEHAAARGAFICMSQSMNIHIADPTVN